MKGTLFAILGVITAVISVFFIYKQVTQKDIVDHTNLYIAIPFLLFTLAFIGLFLSGKINKEEEIHITK